MNHNIKNNPKTLNKKILKGKSKRQNINIIKNNSVMKFRKPLIILIYIVLEILIFFSALYIMKYLYDMYENKKESNLLNEITIDETKLAEIDGATVGSENSSNNENDDGSQKDKIIDIRAERILKLEELQKINSDIVAWIEIENTNISYPVLQSSDNYYYLRRNYKKNYSINGSIFLDKDYSFKKPSTNLLIYGHNIDNGTSFQNLLKYKDKKFYEEHPTIRFTTNKEDSEYEIIAVFRSRLYYADEKNVFRYYNFINAKNEKEYNNFIKNVKKASLYDTGKTAKYGEGLMTLSTCSYHTKDGRFVVVAKKVNSSSN